MNSQVSSHRMIFLKLSGKTKKTSKNKYRLYIFDHEELVLNESRNEIMKRLIKLLKMLRGKKQLRVSDKAPRKGVMMEWNAGGTDKELDKVIRKKKNG